ncbi:MAG: AraC family transcriptional regulator [Hahellaceae bacterium]|nr:AraC family transcriptional regulator [Hahellaceae bacterium]
MDLGFASAPAVLQYLRYANEAGLDTQAALVHAGLTQDQLTDAQARITGAEFQTLLRALIESAKDPLLGLKSGQYVQPGSYSVLGYITMSCATLADAIDLIIPYEKLVGDMGVSAIETTESSMNIFWQCRYTDPLVRPHMIANVLLSWCNYARWLANSPLGPSSVQVEFPLNASEQKAFEDAFDAPVYPSQKRSGLVIDRAYMETPLRQPDPMLRKTLEQHALHQLRTLDTSHDLRSQVQDIIRNQLREGLSRKDLVAEKLDMNARTLQRHLASENTTYQELLDQVRLELAKEYLQLSDMPIHEIAFQLGFAEPRSFHRSFKHWTGKTPGDYRG